MSFRVDKSVWEEAATTSEAPKPPYEGAFDELDAEVDARIQLGAEGSGRYRRSAVLGQGGGGSAAAVAGIPAAPSWHSRTRGDADSGPIRLTDEILASEGTDGDAGGEHDAAARGAAPAESVHEEAAPDTTTRERLEVDVVLPPLAVGSGAAESPERGADRLEIEVTTASGVTLPTTAGSADEAGLVLPSLLAPSPQSPEASSSQDADQAVAFAIPTLVMPASGPSHTDEHVASPASDASTNGGSPYPESPQQELAPAIDMESAVGSEREPDDSPASSGPRRVARVQRAVSRASGFIEVRDDSETVPPPTAAADAGFVDEAASTDAYDQGSPPEPQATAAAPRSWGEESSQTASEEPDADVEELDAEDAEIEEAELDEDASAAAAHDDPAAPEVALAAPIVAAVAADVTPAPPPPPERGRRRPWHEEIFTEGHARLETSRDDELVEREVEFVGELLGLPAGARILDVGTGVGHFAIGLAKRGYKVTGVDSSLAVLLEASNRNEDEGNVASFLHGDMRRLPDDDSYDAVLCLGQTFGYFDDADNQLALEQMRLRLSVGGRLLLQVRSRDHMVARLPCRSWWQGPRCLVLDEGSFDPFTSRVRVHRTVIFEDGRQHEERSDVRVYAPHELVRMLGSVGLDVVRMFGSRLTPEHYFPSVSPEIWILARRTS